MTHESDIGGAATGRQPASAETATLTARQRAFPVPAVVVTIAWIVNAAMLAVSVGAFFVDPRMALAYAEEDAWMLAGREDALERADSLSVHERNRRMASALVVGLLAAASLLLILLGLFAGTSRHRTIRSWLALTALVAGWLVLFTAWPEIAWAGQRWRFVRTLDEYERIADPLRNAWPKDDGADDLLGAYNAYPSGKPTTLMIIAAPRGRLPRSPISLVERSKEGGLRFQLAGGDAGAWLEWHPQGSAPASFTSVMMLDSSYEVTRVAWLGDGWYLTRYVLRSPFMN